MRCLKFNIEREIERKADRWRWRMLKKGRVKRRILHFSALRKNCCSMRLRWWRLWNLMRRKISRSCFTNPNLLWIRSSNWNGNLQTTPNISQLWSKTRSVSNSVSSSSPKQLLSPRCSLKKPLNVAYFVSSSRDKGVGVDILHGWRLVVILKWLR